MAGFFNGIGKARPSAGGVYLKPGKFKVKLNEVKVIRSGTKNVDMFVVAFDILESSNPECAVGTSASWVVNMTQQSALGNIRGFLAAATGEDVDSIDEDVADALVGEDSPLVGNELSVQASMIQTKRGTPFTKHLWEAA